MLDASPIADLHALATELQVEDYRLLSKGEIAEVILSVQSGAGAGAVEALTAERAKVAEQNRVAGAERRAQAEEAARVAAIEKARLDAESKAESGGSEAASRKSPESDGGGRGGGTRNGRGGQRGGRGGQRQQGSSADKSGRRDRDKQPAVALDDATGVLDITQSDGGFVRAAVFSSNPSDAYIGPGEIRKVGLRAGDLLSVKVKPPTRTQRYPSVAEIVSVNGVKFADVNGVKRASFEDSAAAFPVERISGKTPFDKHAPFGYGSRVLIVGTVRQGASTAVRDLFARWTSAAVADDIRLVVPIAPPEEVSAATVDPRVALIGLGSKSDEASAAVNLAIARAKRVAEAGGNAVVLIDGLDHLPEKLASEVFASGRNCDQAGSVTVIAAVAASATFEHGATTVATLSTKSSPQKVKVDKRTSWTVNDSSLR